MATSYAIKIAPDNTGLWQVGQQDSVAARVTELLQDDMEKHHAYFNNSGFHNHISHQMLALYGTGATTEDLNKAYKDNEGYQQPSATVDQTLVSGLRDFAKAKKYLGQPKHYSDWLAFYQGEVERLGWQQALGEYMFKGDERANDMLVRMMAGFMHPLIQLMYGVEWAQPAIVAMALAQASIHQDDLKDFFLKVEENSKTATKPMPRIASLVQEAAANEKLRSAPRLESMNKIAKDIMEAAGEEASALCSRVAVRPEELDERTAEMYNTTVYIASAAAIHGNGKKDPKYDFFLMHHVNVSPIFVTLNKQDWISTKDKVRILEWKIRLDLLQYTARGSPELGVERIRDYVPKEKEPRAAAELLSRVHSFMDDGHAIKLFRAIGVAKEVSSPYEERDWSVIKGDLWHKISHMVADSIEAPGPTWVRSAGFEAAWENVHDQVRGANGQAHM